MATFCKKLLTLLAVFSLCIMSICNFGCFPFLVSRASETVVLISPVPGHNLPFPFHSQNNTRNEISDSMTSFSRKTVSSVNG